MRGRLLRRIGPGMLVAATGVGAGDLAGGAFAGHHLGLACLWAVLLGAGLKYVLNEGLARYQLATGETLLEGALGRLGWPARVFFALYLFPWSVLVGSALASACGVLLAALLPFDLDPTRARLPLGMLQSLLGAALVLRGGFRWFERVMATCIVAMVVTVGATAVLLGPDWTAAARGLVVPSVPHAGGEGLAWTLALIGGVGGTLTVLCYGYWLREEGRSGAGELAATRVDLAAGYAATALFGVAMVLVGSTLEAEGKGAALLLQVGDRLAERFGAPGRVAFLLGGWGAVFSSLLGVWQSVPYLFAEWLRFTRGGGAPAGAGSRAYRGYLIALALAPAAGMTLSFESVQMLYGVVGAAFLPALAAVLLVLGRRSILGKHANGPLTVGALLVALGSFAWLGLLGGVGGG